MRFEDEDMIQNTSVSDLIEHLSDLEDGIYDDLVHAARMLKWDVVENIIDRLKSIEKSRDIIDLALKYHKLKGLDNNEV